MSADLLALLDQLDEARAKATVAMPWRQDSGWGEDIITADGEQFGATGLPADAALIVAAVNALPKLTAALRAVLDVADKLNHDADARGHGDVAWGIRYATAEIHDAITAALTPEQVQP